MTRRAPALDGYWQLVESAALAPAPRAGERPSMSWDVPFELALACSRSMFSPLVCARIARGELPAATALITSSGRELVATLTYPTGDVYLPLRVQLVGRR